MTAQRRWEEDNIKTDVIGHEYKPVSHGSGYRDQCLVFMNTIINTLVPYKREFLD